MSNWMRVFVQCSGFSSAHFTGEVVRETTNMAVENLPECSVVLDEYEVNLMIEVLPDLNYFF